MTFVNWLYMAKMVILIIMRSADHSIFLYINGELF